MVVMDRQDYISKSNNLLAQPAYRLIPRDPTNKMKAKLITILKKVKNQTGLDSNTYKAMYPTGGSASKFLKRSAVGMVDPLQRYTIKNLLVSPKNKDPMAKKCGVIKWLQCGDLTCDDKYIRQTSRTFGESFKEHPKEPSLYIIIPLTQATPPLSIISK